MAQRVDRDYGFSSQGQTGSNHGRPVRMTSVDRSNTRGFPEKVGGQFGGDRNRLTRFNRSYSSSSEVPPRNLNHEKFC